MSSPLRVFSTSRDLLVTSVYRVHPHLAVNLLSIRSTGCAARVLVMAERGHRFEPAFLRHCRLLAVEVAYFRASGRRHTDFFRAVWLLEWLTAHAAEVDRVFYFDAFDAFFQRDPFEHIVAPGRMTFIEEGIPIGRQAGNRRQIAACLGQHAIAAVAEKSVICSGTVAGETDAFLRYLRLLLANATRWEACTVDQPQINWIVWSGEIERAGIPFRIEGCNGTVNSMVYCKRIRLPFDGDAFDISDNPEVLNNAVVHHYKAWRWATKNFYNRCGMKYENKGALRCIAMEYFQ
jgi:hypothetical protein